MQNGDICWYVGGENGDCEVVEDVCWYCDTKAGIWELIEGGQQRVWAVRVAKLRAVNVANILTMSVLSGGPTGRSWCAAVALKGKGRVLVIGGEQSDCEKLHTALNHIAQPKSSWQPW